MRVFFYIPSLKIGGAEKTVVSLSKHLVDNGFSVTIITHCSCDDFYTLDERVERRFIGAFIDGKKANKPYRVYQRIRKLEVILKEGLADVLISMMTTCNVEAIIAKSRCSVKVVAAERNAMERPRIRGHWKFLRKISYRFADVHVAQTSFAATYLEENLGAKNIHIIENGVNLPASSEVMRNGGERPLPAERKYILAVGTKFIQKGFDILLEAFEKISYKYPSWDLVIAGLDKAAIQNSETAFLSRGAQSLLLGSERVRFVGQVKDLQKWYTSASVFVMSSRYEGFPNALLEALSYGIPAVAFDCQTGPREIFGEESCGLLVSKMDAEHLAANIAKIIDSPELGSSLGRAALNRVNEFSSEKINLKWDALLRSVCS